VEALSPLQQRLSALNAEFLWFAPRVSLDMSEHAKQLCFSLLHWKSKCASLPKDTIAGIEDVITRCYEDNALTSWEQFSIAVAFPGLTYRRNITAVEIVRTLSLNESELLAASYTLAKLGFLRSSLQCLNFASENLELSDELLLEAMVTVAADLNTNLILDVKTDSNHNLYAAINLYQILTRSLLDLIRNRERRIPVESIDFAESERIAWFNLQDTIRCLHHVACSGGSVISKCLAAMQGVCLLSEVNPLNRYGIDFNPSNPLLLYEQTQGKAPLDAIKNTFRQQIDQVSLLSRSNNSALILRDHAHSDFFNGVRKSKDEAPGLYGCLEDDYELISVITVRHPLDSYLALVSLGWDMQYQPNTFEEYCARYIDFLDCYPDAPILKYEDFCIDPDSFMQNLCSSLFVDYDPGYRARFGSVELSGDSGRRSISEIKPRGRRPVSDSLKKELADSPSYHTLCFRLGYDADWAYP